MWFQFGGHLEPSDRSVLRGATREAREESGIAELDLDARIVQLDRHVLVAPAFGRCREHLDIRYAACAADGAEPGQRRVARRARGGRWTALPEGQRRRDRPAGGAARRLLRLTRQRLVSR